MIMINNNWKKWNNENDIEIMKKENEEANDNDENDEW